MISSFLLYEVYQYFYHSAQCMGWPAQEQTFIRIQNIAFKIKMFAEDTKKEVPKDIEGIIKAFIESVDDEYSEESLRRIDPKIDITKGIFHDVWGTPIQLSVRSPNDYIFISFGPNRRDDNGQGDDITYSFNPLEMLEIKMSMGALNYVQYGYMGKLCSKTFGSSRYSLPSIMLKVEFWKNLAYNVPPDLETKAWTKAGYNGWSPTTNVRSFTPYHVPQPTDRTEPETNTPFRVDDSTWCPGLDPRKQCKNTRRIGR